MPNSASSIVGEADDARSAAASARTPVRISVNLSPDLFSRSRALWLTLLHATAIPLLVGGIIYWMNGAFSVALFRRAWPVMGLLVAAYMVASVLYAKVDRFPFVHRFEAALVSVGPTLVPAGGVLVGLTGAPIDTVALLAAGASVGWFLLVHCLPPFGPLQFLVLPGGAADRLLALPSIAPEGGAERNGASVQHSGALDAIVADLHAASADGRKVLADNSREGLPVYHAGHISQLLTARVPLSSPAAASLERRGGQPYRYAKRGLDLLLILISLPVTVPLIAGTALAIRLGSRGPVLFWQERVGQGGETFQMAKFRSMHVGHEGEDRAVFAEEDDDRVTPVGRFLRVSRLDELPQIWNVLKGEMSLIGPRPEQVGLAENFDDALRLYHARHLVRPGITGWAQVLHGYAAGVDETRRKLEHDLYYVEHRSLSLDLLILYLTVKTLLTGFGAR